MTYTLFIDDERDPIDTNCIVARSSLEAIEIICVYGMPNVIHFDHDLGGEDTSMKFIKWLEDALLDEKYSLPSNFTIHVHSQNPIGAENIKQRIASWKLHF